MSKREDVGLVLMMLVVIGVVGGLLWLLVVTINRWDNAFDRAFEAEHQRNTEDRKKCEDKGGIAIMSRWNGSLKSCTFPSIESKGDL